MKKTIFILTLILLAALCACSGKMPDAPPAATLPPSTETDVVADGLEVSPTAPPTDTPVNPSESAPTAMPDIESAPATAQPQEPTGNRLRYEDVPLTHNALGLEYAIQEVVIYDKDALFPEVSFDIPGIKNTLAVVEFRYSVNNPTDQRLVDHSPWGVIVLGNPDGEIFEVVRLRDTNGPVTAEETVLNPQLSSPAIPPGESRDTTQRFGLETLLARDVTWLAWHFTCPDDAQGCYGAEETYDVTLQADLADGKALEPGLAEIPMGINPVDYGGVIERGGAALSLERVFVAPVESLPEVTERHALFDGVQALALLVFKLENSADAPRFTFPLVGGMIWEDGERTEKQIIEFADFFRAGLGFGLALDPRQPEWLVVQPGETILYGIWVGLSGLPVSGDVFDISLDCLYPYSDDLVLQSEDEAALSEPPPCLGDEKGAGFHFAIELGAEYQSFGEDLAAFALDTPAAVDLSALGSNKEDFCDIETIQAALQEAISGEDWGFKFQTHQFDPSELRYYGVAAGDMAEISLQGPGPNDRYTLHLTRILYLSKDGGLRSVWMATGFTLDGTEQYTPFTIGGWATNEHAEAIFGRAGQFFEIFGSDWHIDPQGIHWERCSVDGENTDGTVCDLGLLLEQETGWQTTSWIADERTPQDYVAFGWFFNPQGEVLGICAP